MNTSKKKPSNKKRSAAVLALACCLGASAWAHEPSGKPGSAQAASQTLKKPPLDRSGAARTGKASFYGKQFHGKKMADGTPMNPDANIAASRTLPLGTKAEVTNLANGKSEVVEIRDRGPYVDGRIVDVSPRVAEKLDMKEVGVAPVVVRPIEVPQPDGSIKLGAGAPTAETSSGQ
ncbi:MAG TPA: septal ring lytic transglycosylase RlpA family protein [Noviherbaspirillum sp.]|nr:septal ring lytic transglycosylase RlpA family protein [Noviherbaspirillum sp.]